MSWWVYLERDGEPVTVSAHTEGGTHVLGGTSAAELNVTYNYGGQFRAAWPEDDAKSESNVLGRLLDRKRAGETLPLLERMVERLGTVRHPDYWAAAPGNAGHTLSILVAWARQHPDATWSVL